MAKGLQDRKMQRALMQLFKPANCFTVREALIEASRQDLIVSGCDCLIPANPPKEALEARRQANRALNHSDDNAHYHTVANPVKGEKPEERGINKGFWPGRWWAKERKRKGGDRRTL